MKECLCLDVGLWVTRIANIIFTFGYIIPVLGNPTQSYYKVPVLQVFYDGVSYMDRPSRL